MENTKKNNSVYLGIIIILLLFIIGFLVFEISQSNTNTNPNPMVNSNSVSPPVEQTSINIYTPDWTLTVAKIKEIETSNGYFVNVSAIYNNNCQKIKCHSNDNDIYFYFLNSKLWEIDCIYNYNFDLVGTYINKFNELKNNIISVIGEPSSDYANYSNNGRYETYWETNDSLYSVVLATKGTSAFYLKIDNKEIYDGFSTSK